jgi:ferredoxin
MDTATDVPVPRLIDIEGLGDLFRILVAEGYQVIGPAVQDGAIVLRELLSAAELPFGWGVKLEPGGYQLRRRADTAVFGHAAGPQSWKRFLHPPREQLWSATRTPDGFVVDAADDEPRYAFLGVRPCDLQAIGLQDRVLSERADDATVRHARTAVESAADQMGRHLDTGGLHELMADSHDAARWDDVASRCLTCGNCTLACPTCFCTTVEDSTDLTGTHAERWQRWDSCFDLDFSYLTAAASGRRRRAGTGSGSPTSSAPGTTSSVRPAASGAAGASSGARSASTSPKK